MDHGWIITCPAPDSPVAQMSLMSEDASALVQPDISIEVDDVDAAHAAARRLGYDPWLRRPRSCGSRGPRPWA